MTDTTPSPLSLRRSGTPASGPRWSRGATIVPLVPYRTPEPAGTLGRRHRRSARTTSRPPERSALYEGVVTHHRFEPVDHRFSYRIAMTYVDLAEIDAMCRLHPLWSPEAVNVVSFHRADYLGDPAVPLDKAVRDLVEERTGRRPDGPIGLLTQVRTWGWLFNPISIYYCFGADGLTVDQSVVEVTNTPWHERTAYVLPGAGSHVVDKALHVSPFLPMELRHRFTIGEPTGRLVVGVDDLRGKDVVFSASMALERVPADRRSLGRVLWRFPLMTMRVSWGIYRQALALRRKGVPFHPHPGPARRGRPDDRLDRGSGRPLPPHGGVPHAWRLPHHRRPAGNPPVRCRACPRRPWWCTTWPSTPSCSGRGRWASAARMPTDCGTATTSPLVQGPLARTASGDGAPGPGRPVVGRSHRLGPTTCDPRTRRPTGRTSGPTTTCPTSSSP